MTAADLAQRIRGAKQRAGSPWWDGLCPGHEDHRASLSWRDGDRGVVVVRCQAASGCTPERIADALGLTLSDLHHPDGPVPHGHHAANGQRRASPGGATGDGGELGEVVTVYPYHNEAGVVVGEVVRYRSRDGEKTFRPRRPDPARPGRFLWGLGGAHLPLYRLPELAGRALVVIVEGERDADRVATLGMPATTAPGGAQGWRAEYADTLHRLGCERVVVLPDHDGPGERYARDVAATCRARGIPVRVLRLDGLPDRGDVSDWLAAGGAPDELRRLVTAAAEAATLTPDPDAAPAEEPSAPAARLEPDGTGGYIYVLPAPDLTILVGAPAETRGQLVAEVRVYSPGGGDRLLSWSRLNLLSAPSKAQLAQRLGRACSDASLAWGDVLEDMAQRVLRATRESAPAVRLVPKLRDESTRYDLPRLVLRGETTIWFGVGGGGKSYLALTAAVALSTGATLPAGLTPTRQTPCLLLDWESGREDHEDRLAKLLAGLGLSTAPDLYYLRLHRPLGDELRTVRREIARHRIGCVLVDSLAPAAGAGEDFTSLALRAMEHLRGLGPDVSRLVLGHQRKDEGDGPGSVFGSVFFRNLARSVWQVTPDDGAEADALILGLRHDKANAGQRFPAFALRLGFAPGAVTLAPHDIHHDPGLAARAKVPLGERIVAALGGGALTAQDVAEAIGEGTTKSKVQSVSAKLRELRGKGRVARLADDDAGRAVWGLPVQA